LGPVVGTGELLGSVTGRFAGPVALGAGPVVLAGVGFCLFGWGGLLVSGSLGRFVPVTGSGALGAPESALVFGSLLVDSFSFGAAPVRFVAAATLSSSLLTNTFV
jgi:hypothetical protein